jgi:hypothetical protein
MVLSLLCAGWCCRLVVGVADLTDEMQRRCLDADVLAI